MGSDKALLDAGGIPLWRRQWAVLVRAGVRGVHLSVNATQTWPPAGLSVIVDATPESGPLGGLVAVLEKITVSHLAVLAVDLPEMQPLWFRELAAACSPGRGIVGRRDGFYEPLAAIYPRELLPLAQTAVSAGELSLQKLLASAEAAGLITAREISADEAGWFKNWNEPADRGA